MSSGTNIEESSEDEVLRKCLKPNPTDAQLISAIRSTYNTTNVSILKSLESYDDRNWLIQLGSKKCLAKVYNGVESLSFIKVSAEMENSTEADSNMALSSIHLYNDIFHHLNKPKYGVKTSLPIPIPEASKTGPLDVSIHSLPVVSETHSPSKLALVLLDWVEGTTMSSVKTLSIETLLQAGQYLGKICLALDDLALENIQAQHTADRFHAWDGKNTSKTLSTFSSCISDDKRRGLVESVLKSFNEEIGEGCEKAAFRMGILQADFNDANILLDDSGKISGVIDFGDSTYSWRVLDITVAMAYSMITKYGQSGYSIASAAAMLRGFHSVYPLQPEERKHLRLLIACRLSCSVTLGAYSYMQNPQNEYLLFHAEPAWNALELLSCNNDGADTDKSSRIDRIFNIACDERITISKNDEGLPALDYKDIALSDLVVLG